MARPRAKPSQPPPLPRPPNPFGDGPPPAQPKPLFESWKTNFFGTAVFVGAMGLIGAPLLTGAIDAGPGPLAVFAGLGLTAFFGWATYALGKQHGLAHHAKLVATPPPVLPVIEAATNHIETLLKDGRRDLGAISNLVPKLPPNLRMSVKSMLSDGHATIAAVQADPSRLSAVLRLFTYYLPSTLELLKDRVSLSSVAGKQRIEEIDKMIDRLVDAFDGFRRASIEPELASIDLEIGLLDGALVDDFAKTTQR